MGNCPIKVLCKNNRVAPEALSPLPPEPAPEASPLPPQLALRLRGGSDDPHVPVSEEIHPANTEPRLTNTESSLGVDDFPTTMEILDEEIGFVLVHREVSVTTHVKQSEVSDIVHLENRYEFVNMENGEIHFKLDEEHKRCCRKKIDLRGFDYNHQAPNYTIKFKMNGYPTCRYKRRVDLFSPPLVHVGSVIQKYARKKPRIKRRLFECRDKTGKVVAKIRAVFYWDEWCCCRCLCCDCLQLKLDEYIIEDVNGDSIGHMLSDFVPPDTRHRYMYDVEHNARLRVYFKKHITSEIKFLLMGAMMLIYKRYNYSNYVKKVEHESTTDYSYHMKVARWKGFGFAQDQPSIHFTVTNHIFMPDEYDYTQIPKEKLKNKWTWHDECDYQTILSMSLWDWGTWTWPGLDLTEPTMDLTNLNLTLHFRAFLWGLGMTIFGLIVLGFDTRPVTGIMPIIRDRILGIEQRYFLVIFNGFLLYAALLFLLENSTTT